MTEPFAAYLRTSTEDNQSPEDSKRWQLALATDGRWLGGRPNYGYRVVDTVHPYPNRSKASAGAQLRTLEPDPDAAPVVRRIFDLYDAGVGFRSIACKLEADAIPS
ncbi:MAG: recombinase family protein, partial [Mycobacteriales bacterium]